MSKPIWSRDQKKPVALPRSGPPKARLLVLRTDNSNRSSAQAEGPSNPKSKGMLHAGVAHIQ